MHTARLGLSILFFLVGLVWIGQGTGVIGGSAMSGSSFWAVAGVVLLVVAAIVYVVDRRTPVQR